LEEVNDAEGKVQVLMKLISEELVYRFVFKDKEGNRIAIHLKCEFLKVN